MNTRKLTKKRKGLNTKEQGEYQIQTISIIVPAYNEQSSLPITLGKLLEWEPVAGAVLEEILIIDDGSNDSTNDIAKQWQKKDSRIKLITNESNKGKGFSVKRGMLSSSGRIAGFTDADFAYHPDCFNQFILELTEHKADFAVGTRYSFENPTDITYSLSRTLSSRTFQLLVKSLGLKTTTDSQCGLKFFTRKVVQDIFPKLCCEGFVFDVELLHLTQRAGYNIAEVPVKMNVHRTSTIRLYHQIPKMLIELFRIRFRRYR